MKVKRQQQTSKKLENANAVIAAARAKEEERMAMFRSMAGNSQL